MPNNNPTGINQFTKGGGKAAGKSKVAKPKVAKPSSKDAFRAAVNKANFSNPEWVKRGGWSKEDVKSVMKTGFVKR